jgi:hypothetical protein
MVRRLKFPAAVWMGAMLGGAGTMLGGAGVSPALAQDCGELTQQIPGWGTDFGVSLDIDGDTMVISALNDIRVFTRVGSDGPWELEAKLDPEDDDNPFGLGRCARIDRERILAQGQSSRVYVFERPTPGVWKRVAIMFRPDDLGGTGLASGLALSGDLAFVRQINGAGTPTRIHEYQRQEDGSWAYTATLPHPDPEPHNQSYATSIDYEDGTLVAGDSIKRRVYVFERDRSGQWTHFQTIDDQELVGLGGSVSIFSSRAAVGARGSFRVAVFVRDNAGMFTLEQLLKPSVGGGSGLGESVSMQGNLIIAGAPGEGPPSDSGAVYAFVRDEASGLWKPRARFTAPDATAGHQLGKTVAIDDVTALGAAQPFLSVGSVYALDVSTCVPGPCPADCNDDGTLNIFDFLCFQGLVTSGDPDADCNSDGAVNIFDFLCFQGLFTAGCD